MKYLSAFYFLLNQIIGLGLNILWLVCMFRSIIMHPEMVMMWITSLINVSKWNYFTLLHLTETQRLKQRSSVKSDGNGNVYLSEPNSIELNLKVTPALQPIDFLHRMKKCYWTWNLMGFPPHKPGYYFVFRYSDSAWVIVLLTPLRFELFVMFRTFIYTIYK